MTDEERLYKLDNGSDTARWAAEEIRRLRTKNAELNRRSQLAESAVAKFKKQWDDAGGPKGGNFGRALLASECSRLEQELSELRAFKERVETQEKVDIPDQDMVAAAYGWREWDCPDWCNDRESQMIYGILRSAINYRAWKPLDPKACINPTNEAADVFWSYWKENGETHKHGYYESTWGAINAALAVGYTTIEGWAYAIEDENKELRAFKAQIEGQEKLYVVLAPAKQGPDQVFVEIETSKGKSVSIPRQQIERGRYTIVGPLYRHPVAPEGYKLVPIEPTEHMIDAGADSMSWQNYCDDAKRAYKAMISAAPEGK